MMLMGPRVSSEGEGPLAVRPGVVIARGKTLPIQRFFSRLALSVAVLGLSRSSTIGLGDWAVLFGAKHWRI